MTVADTVAPLVRAVVGAQVPVGIMCWDGSRSGPSDAPWQVHIVNRRGLRRLLWAPNDLGFARAYVSGDIDIEGDLLAGLDVLEQVSDPSRGPGVRIDKQTKKALATAALRLGIIGLPPKPPAEEMKPARGHRHDKDRDAAAISHHYDVGNGFYRLVLGESMTYSCAYWAEPSADLDAAQYAKCDLVARKLGLTAGMRVLDVGCGWGTFALHAARNYGVHVVGVTLSHEQAEYAGKRMVDAGVGDLVQIRVQDYRDVTDGPYDAISSIGMAEHVGAAMLATYAADLFALLRPRGRLLNHAISRRPGKPAAKFSKTSFIDRYVFPDGEIEPIAPMIEALEGAGFEVRDVESLREHYALTLRAWVGNLEANWDEAVSHSSAGRARVWRLYMAGAALAFAANRFGINQVLAVKSSERGDSGMPGTRAELLQSSAPIASWPGREQ
ncbi:class I SAM-dependent methyltransferase [Rhodococcus opacus]|uniref:class I SAM-dependent methyltransferase n=1 Tax=Rhodococcus opacus TaxID=37919 RepID=UPI0002A38B23|nr:class I SAM-dependent methyltransferase [Rhodococcus opacus]ELB89937.1 cyclopropane-fatty-acyl-phospholipid synthase [Rhodococcus wratislaviensis IFP 2016]MDX5964545.1 class I SAM-dependent methyltransferase [Rhodococcus opacus]NKY72868.1 methyltransferase domain-containing protein [Rhodococcus opacus]CAG7626750.1 putative fatty acid methyltransferase [Rhodococcus opacus]